MRRHGTVFALCLMAPAARGGDWPQFRGPGGQGLPADALPSEWGPEKNVAWKVAVPGAAWSCPVVVGDKLFLTTAVTDNQRKPSGGSGGGGGGGGRPPGGGGAPGGGRGGRGGPPDAVYKYQVLCLDRATGPLDFGPTCGSAAGQGPMLA